MMRCFTQTYIITELAQKLPMLREGYNISQTQLGNLIGKSRQQISKIERGITPMGWDTCLAIIMVMHNKNTALFNKVMGEGYYTQIHNYIKGSKNIS